MVLYGVIPHRFGNRARRHDWKHADDFRYATVVPTVNKLLNKINISGSLVAEEPMSRHTTFEVGGPAELYAVPHNTDDICELLRLAEEEGLSWFVLGGGANILVSDRGIRGLVIDMRAFNRFEHHDDELILGAGMPVSDAVAAAAERGLGGLEFLYSMPGSVGGAVWMNARCYGHSVEEVLTEVRYVDEYRRLRTYTAERHDFAYKRSPFQDRKTVMYETRFRVHPADPSELAARMREYKEDRASKGHFAAPSAGSVFKNNRAFGAPTGQLLDSIGLRGYQIGCAKVSDLHANIVINCGGADAAEIRAVIEHMQQQAQDRLGLTLEREVLYAGEW